MAPSRYEEDWSDSEDEDATGDGVETAVQLGVPNGQLEAASDDVRDAAVSRIGGHPAFLTAPEPPISSALCTNCSSPMELLVQMWCPLEESPYDRALYIWGCARGVCQRMDGSVRAWRGLRYNESFAKKLEEKQAKLKEKEAAKAKAREEQQRRKAAAKVNPFKMAAPSGPNPFGLGAQIFGGAPPPAIEESNGASNEEDVEEENADDEDEDEDDNDEEDDEDELVTALAATSLETSEWKAAPAYNCLYLDTVAEYLPPTPKSKVPPGVELVEDDGKGDKDLSWASEGYENSLDVDHAFERFSKRVGYEGEQCIRYERGGTPLPFASDKIFDQLFPAPPPPNLPVTRPDSMVVPPQKRVYDPASVPKCPRCKSKRVFECQAMPNLINVLKWPGSQPAKPTLSDEQRRKEVEKALKGGAGVEQSGMEWGACMVFSCEKDCCEDDDGKEAKSCWREEVVLIQWDN